MSKNSLIITIIIIAFIVIGAIVFLSQPQTQSLPSAENEQSPPLPSEPPLEEITVNYSDAGYSPSSISIKAGQTIIFKNNSSQPMWTASAFHPTHLAYPGSDIKKCNTAEAEIIFDSCFGTSPDDFWLFQFNEIGEWKYHNHLNPSHFGAVVVE